MIVYYYVLYRNGHEDVIPQKVSGEEERDSVARLNGYIKKSFEKGLDGYLSLGNGATSGTFIRLTDVIRIRIEVEKEGAE